MKLTRMDLDMTGSPLGLITKILAAEPELPIPTPIELLASNLDIVEIADLTSEGFEGGLITQPERTNGIILVNKFSHPFRRRFTIGHELGHFLLPTHQPIADEKFLCSREDMAKWDVRSQDRYMRMESEANQFSALLLILPPRLRAFLKSFKDPDIADILTIAENFEVSKEAAARSYVEYHDDYLAVAIVKDGKILRTYKRRDFPFITATNGAPIPSGSNFKNYAGQSTEMKECHADVWIDKQGASLYEQIHMQRDGYALVLLWAELLDEADETDIEENQTSSERYKNRISKWQR
ncbi:MAG: ImmA/IrrE family metallo-endopeptidase [Nitrosomonas sp.]|nr:ImmA/IrrE family metallo-endopeptidase [Nitrosomonas sp.]